MNVLDILFPRKCPICQKVNADDGGICSECREKMTVVMEPTCKRCGKPLSHEENEYCMDCAGKKSVLTQGTALWLYDDVTRKAMADFKYDGCTEDGVLYAKEFVRHRGELLRSWKLDCIIPVPLYWKKQWFRGFNQAEHLAGEIGRFLKLPVLEEGILRQYYTKPQKGLSSKQRMENLKNSMVLNEAYIETLQECSRVLLVDDIYTTGATLEACGLVLKDIGVKQIYFSCLCIGKDY